MLGEELGLGTVQMQNHNPGLSGNVVHVLALLPCFYSFAIIFILSAFCVTSHLLPSAHTKRRAALIGRNTPSTCNSGNGLLDLPRRACCSCVRSLPSCPGCCVTSAFEGNRFPVVCWKAGGGELPGTSITDVDARVFCSLLVT